jgi:flagellar hook-associated protein 1 FlgK
MTTLNTALSIASGALDADQAALNIVANNTANANTAGYTREIANWEENDSITISGISYGDGATVTGAVSQRDSVLEQSMQQQTQTESASSARLSALDALQALFTDATSSTSTSSTSTGIGSDMTAFFDAVSSLESSPSDNSLRQAVLSTATTLASDFNSTSTQLAAQQQSIDEESTSVVTQVNTLTQSIAKLNQEIQSASPTGDAGTLQDQRDEDITQLSQLVGISQISTEKNGLTITTTSGAVLVEGSSSFALTTGTVNGVTDIFDSNGNDITSGLAAGGGELGGLLTVRDQDIPQVQSALDQLAYSLGSQVNTVNEAGSDLNGNAGVAIFDLPTSSSGAASQISVAITDPSLVAAAASGDGSSDGTNATAMAALESSAIVSGTTPTQYYSDMVTTLGSLVSDVSTENTAQQASLTQMQTQISSISSVNLDDEASSLEDLEKSYEAASKVFSILEEVMVSALNLGVETTLT